MIDEFSSVLFAMTDITESFVFIVNALHTIAFQVVF